MKSPVEMPVWVDTRLTDLPLEEWPDSLLEYAEWFWNKRAAEKPRGRSYKYWSKKARAVLLARILVRGPVQRIVDNKYFPAKSGQVTRGLFRKVCGSIWR